MESKARLSDVSVDFRTGNTKLTFTLDRELNEDTINALAKKDIRLKAIVWREKRSLDSNAYFHVLCQKIAEKLHTSLTEVKNRMIADYGQLDKELHDIILKDSIDWTKLQPLHLHPTTATKVLDNGELYRVYLIMRGSHTYDSKEMSMLISGTVEEAKLLGIETATPAELARMNALWKERYEREHHQQ